MKITRLSAENLNRMIWKDFAHSYVPSTINPENLDCTPESLRACVLVICSINHAFTPHTNRLHLSSEQPTMSSDNDARFWDKASEKYSKSPVADQAGYGRTLDKTRSLLGPDVSVLELGCGTGSTAMHLAPGVRRYLGTDISPNMIEIANSKNTAGSAIPALVFRVATAEALAADTETETARFDAVLAFNYLHLVRDLSGTLRSINKLLAPGGLFISKTPCIRDMTVGLVFLPLLPLVRAVGFAPFAAVFSAEDLRKQVEAAGFEIVITEYHATGKTDTRPYIIARKAMA